MNSFQALFADYIMTRKEILILKIGLMLLVASFITVLYNAEYLFVQIPIALCAIWVAVSAEVRRKVAQIDKDLSRYMSYRALKWVLKISIGIASVILYVLAESQPKSSKGRGPDSHDSFGGGDLTSDGWSGEHYYTFERPDGSIT